MLNDADFAQALSLEFDELCKGATIQGCDPNNPAGVLTRATVPLKDYYVQIPEPGTTALAVFAVGGFAALRRRDFRTV